MVRSCIPFYYSHLPPRAPHPLSPLLQVIDEADRILEIGFEEEMRQIVNILPKDRQTMLFSATQTTKVGLWVGGTRSVHLPSRSDDPASWLQDHETKAHHGAKGTQPQFACQAAACCLLPPNLPPSLLLTAPCSLLMPG